MPGERSTPRVRGLASCFSPLISCFSGPSRTPVNATANQDDRPLARALATLPPDVLPTILLQAGLHTRQVCQAFHSLHPPILSLAPSAPPETHKPYGTETPAMETPAPVPPTLTSLDLRDYPLHPSTLSTALPPALPMLQSLTLHPSPSDHYPHILSALHCLPHLHTLHAPAKPCSPYSPHQPSHPAPPPSTWAPLLHPLVAPRLRALTLPIDALPTLLTAPPASLPNLASLALQSNFRPEDTLLPLASTVYADLPIIAPAILQLSISTSRCLHPQHVQALATTAHLSAITALTSLSLSLSLSLTDNDVPPATAPTLHHIAALTGLHCLTINLPHGLWTPQEAGWLSPLTRLTHLDITFHLDSDEVVMWPQDGDIGLPAQALIITEAARGAADLPLVRTLHLSFPGLLPWHAKSHGNLAWLACGTQESFFHCLAAATQLHSLHLEGIPMMAHETHLLSSLRNLTCLCLTRCKTEVPGSTVARRQGSPNSVPWVAVLTRLQQLEISSHQHVIQIGKHQLPSTETSRAVFADTPVKRSWPLLAAASLPPGSLHTLTLTNLCLTDRQQGQLGELLLSVGSQLVRLSLAGMVARDVLRKLHLLTRLTVVNLAGVSWLMSPEESGDGSCKGVMLSIAGVMRRWKPPASLRRCYLMQEPYGSYGSSKTVPEELRKLQQKYPLVDFRLLPFDHARFW